MGIVSRCVAQRNIQQGACQRAVQFLETWGRVAEWTRDSRFRAGIGRFRGVLEGGLEGERADGRTGPAGSGVQHRSRPVEDASSGIAESPGD